MPVYDFSRKWQVVTHQASFEVEPWARPRRSGRQAAWGAPRGAAAAHETLSTELNNSLLPSTRGSRPAPSQAAASAPQPRRRAAGRAIATAGPLQYCCSCLLTSGRGGAVWHDQSVASLLSVVAATRTAPAHGSALCMVARCNVM